MLLKVASVAAFAGSLFLLAAVLMATAAEGQKPELRVAAAADLQTVMPALAAEYERKTGVHLVVSYGSSATLTQQIENGAPVDVFLSADMSFPERLAAAKLTDAPPVTYARGELVLWSRKDSALQPLTLRALESGKLERLAVANPSHAPYGRAAMAALSSMHLSERLKPKLVMAENIAQTAQFAESGNAQAGLISLTIASSPHFRETGTYVVFPSSAYPPILQGVVVMRRSARPQAGRAFVDWILGTDVQGRLRGFGLRPAKD